MARSRIYLLGTALVPLTACNTSEVPIGQALLLWCLPMLAVTIGLEALFARIKYRRARADRPKLNRTLITRMGVASVVLPTLAIIAYGWRASDWFGGAGAYGALGYTVYLAFAFIGAHLVKHPRSSNCAVLVPFLLATAGAAVLTFSGATFLVIPLFAGVFLPVGLPLLVIAFVWAYLTPHTAAIPSAVARYRTN